jgi:excisionase family DNA binding protein
MRKQQDEPPPAPSPVMTAEELADYLRVSKDTIYRLLKEGLPGFRIHHLWRFNREHVDQWRLAHGQVKK